MDERITIRRDTRPRQDPYRFWLIGMAVELGAFGAFLLFILGVSVVLVLAFGG